MHITPGVTRDLRAIPATKELFQRQVMRALSRAVAAGLTQREISTLVEVSQPEISRLLKKAAARPELLERGPRDVLLEHAANLIDHEQMMRELLDWPYTFGRFPDDDPMGETYLPGTWDQIERAGDLLTDEDYRRLLEATSTGRRAHRRAG